MKIQSVNNFVSKNYFKKEDISQSQQNEAFATNSFDSKAADAFKIYALTSPSFKNLAMPIDVTNRYNKRLEGQDHLDLPNVRVYEYPDTNLKVFVSTENFSQMKNDFMYKPQVLMKVYSNNRDNSSSNILYDNAIKLILYKKLNEQSKDIVFIPDANAFSYFEPLVDNTSKDFSVFNKTIFDLKILDDDIKYLSENQSTDNVNFTKSSLQDYYNKNKDYLRAECYVVASDEDKKHVLTSINKNINIKLDKDNISDTREIFLNELTAIVLSSYKDFNKNFVIKKTFDTNSGIKFTIFPKNKTSLSELKEIKQKIIASNIDKELEAIKTSYKKELKKSLDNNQLPVIKVVAMSKYGKDIFNLFEIIDSISEKDIKNYVSYF